MTLERPALQSLLADCRAGKIGTVITQDLERLSRNPLSLIAVLESFLEDGVNVEFSTAEATSPDRSRSRSVASTAVS